ncbi:MAG: AzlD domain-containing protein [Coriobacteriales bacterium]|jgi:branched-subunit amino acid transport protein|nr:AzlD domain-containing protein [Coriobacteriales bacterium]
MSWASFLIILACCMATMLACRVLPLFVLKGRQLPERLEQALGYIPPAAFAALVANDLLTLPAAEAEPWPILIPLLAAIPVVVIARKTRSLLWCIVAGVATFGLLMLIPL